MKLVLLIPKLIAVLGNKVIVDVKNAELPEILTDIATTAVNNYTAAIITAYVTDESDNLRECRVAEEISSAVYEYLEPFDRLELIHELFDNIDWTLNAPAEISDDDMDYPSSPASSFGSALFSVLTQEKESLGYYVDAISYALGVVIGNKFNIKCEDDETLVMLKGIAKSTGAEYFSVAGEDVHIGAEAIIAEVD